MQHKELLGEGEIVGTVPMDLAKRGHVISSELSTIDSFLAQLVNRRAKTVRNYNVLWNEVRTYLYLSEDMPLRMDFFTGKVYKQGKFKMKEV